MRLKRFPFLGLLTVAVAGCSEPDLPIPALVVQLSAVPNSQLLVNPTGYAPLSAQLNFTTAGAGTIEIRVHGRHGTASDLTQTVHDAGPTHLVPILGLYADYSNEVDITFTPDNGSAGFTAPLEVHTDPLPANLPTAIDVTQAPTAPLGSSLTLVSNFSANNPYIPLIVDNFGDVRWLLNFATHPVLKTLAYDCGISHLRNGHYLFGNKNNSQLYEVSALGELLNTWPMPGYTFHHEVVEKPNGNFLLTVNKTGSTHPDGTLTTEDFVLELDRHSGALVHEWDLRALLDENRHALEPDPVDWLHANAVLYDPADNTVVISGRFQGVVKVGYDDRVVWLLGPHRGWGRNRLGQDLNQYLLTPLNAAGEPITDPGVPEGSTNHPDFQWNWYQHSPTKMPNGDWLLFDNGTHRNFEPAPGTYSRAVAYRIDPVRMTVQQVWAYGQARGTDTYSSIVSRVEYLPNVNHVRFCPGYQVPTATGLGGKIVEVDYATRQPVFEMDLTAANGFGFHRADVTHFGQ